MSDYTGRELDIMYREAFEAGQEQGRADMVSERDRLREGHRLIKVFAEHIRDNSDIETLVRRRAGNIISWIEINAELQEDGDDTTDN